MPITPARRAPVSVALLAAPPPGAQGAQGAVRREAYPLDAVAALERQGFAAALAEQGPTPGFAAPLVREVLGRAERRCPELPGLGLALANRRLLCDSDVTLAISEDAGAFAALARGLRLGALAPRRLALMVCRMAEWAGHAERRTLLGYRRVLAGADLVVCFSANQEQVFQRTLGVDPARLLCVPLGVDQHLFAPRPELQSPPQERYVLAVGEDPYSDHQLLLEAVRNTRIPVRIHAPRPASGDLPPNVTWVSDPLDGEAYRRAIAGAALVAVPTRPAQHPAGSTLLLAAMASGIPVVATRSQAMRDYVSHGVNGLLVPPGDAVALARAVQRLLADPQLSDSLAREGRLSVERRFNQEAMWSQIAARLRQLAAQPPRARERERRRTRASA
jgi:hypothetical protein